jgi:transcription antitermination factor NusG
MFPKPISPTPQLLERLGQTWPDTVAGGSELLASQASWYALHVRSDQEHLVSLQLERVGIESFYPRAMVNAPRQSSRDKIRQIEKRFMPGYVFSRFDLAKRAPVTSIVQVVRILGYGFIAVPIPDAEIEAVRTIMSVPESVRPCAFLAQGDRVRVRYGPLTGLEGFVQHWKKKAWVVVSLTGPERSLCATVDPECLESIPAAKAA